MKCLICNVNFNEVLRNHYIYYHSVDENNYFFRELFSPDNTHKQRDDCRFEFEICRQKKNHNFIFHYNQTGDSRNQQLPINILRRGKLFYYSINFEQHKEFYGFYNERIVDDFFNSVHEIFEGGKGFKI